MQFGDEWSIRHYNTDHWLTASLCGRNVAHKLDLASIKLHSSHGNNFHLRIITKNPELTLRHLRLSLRTYLSFQSEPGLLASPLGSLSSHHLEETSYGISGTVARSPSCHPANSVKELKETQSIEPNHWPGLNLSSSTPESWWNVCCSPYWYWLSDASTSISARVVIKFIISTGLCFPAFFSGAAPGETGIQRSIAEKKH